MLTKQSNLQSQDLDQLPSLEIIQLMNDEDTRVPVAIHQVLPDIAQAVDSIVKNLRGDGRLIYVGAGTSGRLGILDTAETAPTFSVDRHTVQALIAGGASAFGSPIEGMALPHYLKPTWVPLTGLK